MSDLFTLGVIDDYGLDVYEFRILHRVNRRGECTESTTNMGAALGISEKKVRLVLSVLEAAGLIARRKRPGQTDILTVNPLTSWPSPSDFQQIKSSKAPVRRTPVRDTEVTDTAPPGTEYRAPRHGIPDTPVRDTDKGNPCKGIPLRVSRKGETAAEGGPTQDELKQTASSDDQADGRKSEKRKRAASQDPPGLVEFRARLKAHRENKLGAPDGASYHTQEANGIRALYAKVEAGACTEADCVELFDSKHTAWLNRGMSGYTPNWIYVAQDVEPYIKGRAVVIQMPQKKTGFLTQADINSPRKNRVCL